MKTQQLFAIGIPTINRADLLEETLLKYQKDFPNTDIFIVDNGHQHFVHREEYGPNIHFICNMENLGVAASWNQLSESIFWDEGKYMHKYAIILNDDVYWGKTENQVREYIEENLLDTLGSFYTTTNTWCNFIFDIILYDKIGEFDEKFFPAYFEDNDYEYRMKLAQIEVNKSDFMNPKIYRNSQTIEKNPSLNKNFSNNLSYYIAKWNGAPGKETFTTEFNR